MLIVDWLIWRLLLERKFLDSEKNTLRDELTTPTNCKKKLVLEVVFKEPTFHTNFIT